MFKEIQPFLEYFDSPWLWALVFVMIIIPLLLAIVKQVYNFHGSHIRYFKTKSYEYALNKIEKDSVEYKLFEEFKNQELFYINTRIRASKKEREQILCWVTKKSISIDMINKAWSMIGVKNEEMQPIIYWYDKVYFIYTMACVLCCFASGIFLLIASFSVVFQPGWLKIILLSAFLFLMSVLFFFQATPYAYVRKIKYRLDHG